MLQKSKSKTGLQKNMKHNILARHPSPPFTPETNGTTLRPNRRKLKRRHSSGGHGTGCLEHLPGCESMPEVWTRGGAGMWEGGISIYARLDRETSPLTESGDRNETTEVAEGREVTGCGKMGVNSYRRECSRLP